MIGDDGIGMDKPTLDQAHRLGSLTERNVDTDLGKFGMGLVTASLSLSRRTQVISKQRMSIGRASLMLMRFKIAIVFANTLLQVPRKRVAYFTKSLEMSESGTLIILSKTDGLTNKNTTQFANILRKHLGEVHRYFLKAGKTMYVNGEDILPVDPLMLDESETEVFSDDLYPFEIEQDGERSTEHVRIRIVLVPKNSAAGESEEGTAHNESRVLCDAEQSTDCTGGTLESLYSA